MKRKLLSLAAVVVATLSFAQEVYTTQNANIPMQSAGVRDFSVVDTNTAWVTFYDGSGGGTYPRYVGVTTNGGSTWNTRLASSLASSALISDVQGLDGTTAFMVTAPTGSVGSANGLWKTTNAGESWTKIQGVFSSASFGNIVHIWDNGTGLVIGDPVNNKYEMYKTTNFGNTWTTLTTAPIPDTQDEYGYVGGKVLFENHIWLTSNTGKILHSADYGTTWDHYYTPLTDFAGEDMSGDMAFSSPTYGLIVDSNSMLWYTENGGEEWDIKESANYFNGDLAYVPGTENTFISTGIAAASLLGTGTAYSNDGGTTWETLDALDQRGAIGVLDRATVYVGHFTSSATGEGGILKLNNPIPEGLAVTDLTSNKVELKAVVNNRTLNLVANKEIKSTLITDMTGRKVTEVAAKDINISNLKPGTYVARVAYADGAYGTVKFLVK